jgi:hypothetical protein
MTTADTLDRGRESFERRAWADAFVKLSAADRETPLAPEDLERLATAAYLVGRDADSDEVWRARIRRGCGWAARTASSSHTARPSRCSRNTSSAMPQSAPAVRPLRGCGHR